MKSSALLSRLLIFLFAIAVVACKEEDGGEDTPSSRILGIWTLNTVETDITINGQDYVTYIQALDNLTEQEKQLFLALVQAELENITFEQGSTIEFKSGSNYEAKTPDESPETGTYTLSADGKTLTMDPGTADEQELEVTTLSNSNLTLVGTDTDNTTDLNEDGTNEEVLAVIQLNLTK